MSGPRPPASVLDRPIARAAAALVLVASVAVIAWYHRDDLFSSRGAAAGAAAGAAVGAAVDPAHAACIARRFGDIDRMVADGMIDPDRAATIKRRVRGLCRDAAAR